MIFINSFIKVYDQALDKSICKNIINIFENADKNNFQFFENNGYPNFVRLKLSSFEGHEDYKDIFQKIRNSLELHKNKYIESLKLTLGNEKYIMGFNDHSYDSLMIKKYNNNDKDKFDMHIDNFNNATSNRFLVMLYYLNTVGHGGHTHFPSLDIKISPEEGRLLIFPPNFLFPHAGLKPISNSKYILTTYLIFNK